MLNPNSTLNVVTYNQGRSIADYALACWYSKIEPTTDDYEIAQHKTAACFKDLAGRGQIHAILLQEVNDKTRPLMKALKSEGFKTFNVTNNKNNPEKVRNSREFDCAVLLSRARFKDFDNRSVMINGIDTPIVLATDRETNQRMLFVSAHVPGCMLDQGRVDPPDARDGDNYIQVIINKVDEISTTSPSSLQIIGADMNANPEKLNENRTKKQQWEHRFKKLENSGFQTYRTKETTEVYPKSTYAERELDFIFARTLGPKKSWLSSLISSSTPLCQEKQTSVLLNFRLDTDNIPLNASDHRPVMTEFLVAKAAESKLSEN